MIWLRLVPWGLALVGIAAAGFLFWRLGQAHEQIGSLEHANKSLTESLAAKEKATQSRAQTQQKVRQMAPAEKLERLK